MSPEGESDIGSFGVVVFGDFFFAAFFAGAFFAAFFAGAFLAAFFTAAFLAGAFFAAFFAGAFFAAFFAAFFTAFFATFLPFDSPHRELTSRHRDNSSYTRSLSEARKTVARCRVRCRCRQAAVAMVIHQIRNHGVG